MPLTGFMRAVSIADATAVEDGLESKTTCEKNQDAIIIAAERGDVSILQLLLDKGSEFFNVNYIDYRGNTPLVVAIRMGHVAAVKYLVNREDINLFLESPRRLVPFSVALLTDGPSQCEILFHLLNTKKILATHIEAVFQIISSPSLCKNFINFLLQNIKDKYFDDELFPSLDLLQHESIACIARYAGMQTPLGQAIQSLNPIESVEVPVDDSDPEKRAARLIRIACLKVTEPHPKNIAMLLIDAHQYNREGRFVVFFRLYEKYNKVDQIRIMRAMAQTGTSNSIALCVTLLRGCKEDRAMTALFSAVIEQFPEPIRVQYFKEFKSSISKEQIAKLLRYRDIRECFLQEFRGEALELLSKVASEDDAESYQALSSGHSINFLEHLNLAIRNDCVKMTTYLLTSVDASARSGYQYTGSSISMAQLFIRSGCNFKCKFERTKLPLIALLYDISSEIHADVLNSKDGRIASLSIAKKWNSIDIQRALLCIRLIFSINDTIFLLSQCLAAGFNVNTTNVFGVSLLHRAANFSFEFAKQSVFDALSVAKFLRQCGADFSQKCIDGGAPHALAEWTNNQPAIDYFKTSTAAIKYTAVNTFKDNISLWWKRACNAGEAYFIWCYWLEVTDEERNMALLYVIASDVIQDEAKRLAIVQALLKDGAKDSYVKPLIANAEDVNQHRSQLGHYQRFVRARTDAESNKAIQNYFKFPDDWSYSPYLLEALIFGYPAFYVAVQRNLQPIVEIFHASEQLIFTQERYQLCDVTHDTDQGKWLFNLLPINALSLATDNDNFDMTSLLVNYGWKLYHYAFTRTLLRGQERMAQYLLNLLDEVNTAKERMRGIINLKYVIPGGTYTALDFAAQNASFDMVEKLLIRGGEYTSQVLACAFSREDSLEKRDIILILLYYMNQQELSKDKKLEDVKTFNWRAHVLTLGEEHETFVKQVLMASETRGSALYYLSTTVKCEASIATEFSALRQRLLSGFSVPRDAFFSRDDKSGGAAAITTVAEITNEGILSFRKMRSEVSKDEIPILFSVTLNQAIAMNNVELLGEVIQEVKRVMAIYQIREMSEDSIALKAILERDNLGRALLNAAALGHCAVIKILLEQGAPVNYVREDDKMTALHIAAQAGHAEVVRLLLESDANPELTESSGKTYLQLATEEFNAAFCSVPLSAVVISTNLTATFRGSLNN